MKRILSLIIAATFLISVFSFNAFAEENEEAKRLACYRIDWSTQSFFTYAYKEKKTDINYTKYFNVDKTARYINTTGTTTYDGSGGGRAYFSQQMFTINDSTHYEYVFKAKNNIDKEYAGVVFAFGGGLAYIMYGSFNNTAESPNVGVSSVKLTKGYHASSSNDCSTGFDERFLKVDLDNEGFGHYKIVYKGYNVSVYALTDIEKGTYTQMGSSIKLPSDAKVALGVYARTELKGPNRTVNLSDCLLYAMNSQTEQILFGHDDGTCRLLSLIEEAKTNYSAADNTGATYRELMREVQAAEELLESWNFSSSQISDMEKRLDDALDQMEVKEADKSKLKAAITSFEALIAEEYTELSYKMVLQAINEGKALLSKEDARQSRIDNALKRITDRMTMLVPSGYKAPETNVVETGAESSSESSTGTDNVGVEKGCKSILVGSSILGIFALVGVAAIVVKKKED